MEKILQLIVFNLDNNYSNEILLNLLNLLNNLFKSKHLNCIQYSDSKIS